MRGLFTENLTVTERTGEDASGHATTRVTALKGYAEFMSGRSKQQTGITSANALFAAIDPSGYPLTWSIKPGDKLTALGVTVEVKTARACKNPRTGIYHHIEVEGG